MVISVAFGAAGALVIVGRLAVSSSIPAFSMLDVA
jgi:hypothetical protein